MQGDTEALERLARRQVVSYLEEIQARRLNMARLINTTSEERDQLVAEVEQIDFLIDWIGGPRTASRGAGDSDGQGQPGKQPEGQDAPEPDPPAP